MILLEHVNTITHDLILGFLQSPEGNRFETKCADFDGCELHVWTEGSVVNMSLRSGAAQSLLTNGGLDVLKQVYGTALQPTAESSYDVQISQDTSSIGSSEREAFATKFSSLKGHLYSAPLTRCIQSATANQVVPGMTDIPLRSVNERMWVKQDDTERITVIFSIDFSDPDDAVFGRVFLNEIKKPVQGAPTVDFSIKNPPMELRGINTPKGDNVSYVTFVLFKRHWTPIQKAQAAVFTLVSFRNYLHYHIKCCKSYLHTRMRLQVENLLKVLNRAKQEGPKEKKLASGRTFVRR